MILLMLKLHQNTMMFIDIQLLLRQGKNVLALENVI